MASLRRILSVQFRNTNIYRTNNILQRCVRNFSIKTPLQSYESDGKTTVNILNNEQDAPLMINGYSLMGFRLNNGLFVVGPTAIFPNTVLSWDIGDDSDINEKSLSLFLHLAPKLDVLVIGVSDSRNHKLIVDTRRRLYELMRNRGEKINVEVLPTEKAVTTFNFLNSEGRFVGAALIPPTFYTPTLDDEYRVGYLSKKKEEGDYLLDDK